MKSYRVKVSYRDRLSMWGNKSYVNVIVEASSPGDAATLAEKKVLKKIDWSADAIAHQIEKINVT